MLIEHVKRGDLDDEQAASLARDLVVLAFALAVTVSDTRQTLGPKATVTIAQTLADNYLQEPSK